MHTLILQSVGKRHGGIEALRDVSFCADAGEFLVVLGPNGAGKTTLVHLLTALYPPDAGRIEVMGVDLAADPVAALRGIGVVFQEQTLDLDLSVSANLRFHAGLHGLPRRQAAERIGALLARFRLAERAGAPARSLSGGNRRRLELARALLHCPSVLVMDEPTVGLDPDSRAELIAHVRALCEEGALVIWTTHLLDEIAPGDRVLRLQGGRVLP
jgi:ABC-2 type transport system ATP-binding protein